jgi:HSP20 family protein
MLMRTDPFRELDRMTQQRAGTQAQPLAMPMDAFRQGDEFIVDIDLPGIAVDSIDLTIDQNVLTVRAARRRNAQEGVELLIAERPTGEFSRQLLLGETLDVDRIAADYTDGVLRIRVPIAEKARPRRLHVDTGQSAAHAINRQAADS